MDLAQLDVDVMLIKQFFEEIIQCVVGCGCYEPGWDNEAALRAFARAGFPSWIPPPPPPTPREVVAALDRCCERVTDAETRRISKLFEHGFVNAAAFRSFFAESRRVLHAELD